MSILTINNHKITVNGHKIWINQYGLETIANPVNSNFTSWGSWLHPYDGWSIANNKIVIDASASSSSWAATQSGIVDGKTYKMTVEISDYVYGTLFCYIGGSTGLITCNNNGTQSSIFQKQISDTYLYLQIGSNAFLNIKNISIKEVLKY